MERYIEKSKIPIMFANKKRLRNSNFEERDIFEKNNYSFMLSNKSNYGIPIHGKKHYEIPITHLCWKDRIKILCHDDDSI